MFYVQGNGISLHLASNILEISSDVFRWFPLYSLSRFTMGRGTGLANEVTGSEVSHWFSLCTICDLNLLSQSSARMGKVQDCRVLQDIAGYCRIPIEYWILWNTILVTWIWPHLWSVETLNEATKQLSFWGPGWKPLGFLIKAVVKPALWPLQREPKEESCLIMSHLIHILYLFNLFALQASVTPKKIFPDWTPACSSLQSDFALATNANPHTAHKDHTLKIRWRVLESYCFLPTSGHVHCLTLCQSCFLRSDQSRHSVNAKIWLRWNRQQRLQYLQCFQQTHCLTMTWEYLRTLYKSSLILLVRPDVSLK